MRTAGRRRYYVKIEKPVQGAADAFGKPAIIWEEKARTWAQIEPLSGTELWLAQQVVSEMTHRITTRDRIAGITSAWRIRWQDRIFAIAAVLDMRTHLEMHCVERPS